MVEIPKSVLVVGASRGIGEAIADYFQVQDRPCIRAARSFKNPSLAGSGNRNYEIHLDVTDVTSVKSLFSGMDDAGVELNTIVFAAGVGHFDHFEDISLEQWQESVATNLTGAFITLQAAYQHLKDRGNGGRVITIGSVADHLALADNAAYGATKFGLRGLMAVMHEEGRRYGISAMNISLGATYTDIWKARPDFSSKDMLSPAEVAEAVFKLATLPSRVTIPNIVITPPKGIL